MLFCVMQTHLMISLTVSLSVVLFTSLIGNLARTRPSSSVCARETILKGFMIICDDSKDVTKFNQNFKFYNYLNLNNHN